MNNLYETIINNLKYEIIKDNDLYIVYESTIDTIANVSCHCEDVFQTPNYETALEFLKNKEIKNVKRY
jgi:hypothetical protein